MKRKIIQIDHELCNGCGLCLPNCPEGALQLIDGKARLVSDLFCDGLGACIGTCPQAAITIEERDAQPYDEKETMGNIVKHGAPTIQAHLKHLAEHGQHEYLQQALGYLREKNIKVDFKPMGACACPGSKMMDMRAAPTARPSTQAPGGLAGRQQESQLQNWPVQLQLLNPAAPYFQNAELVIAADCTAFAHADFHQRFLPGNAGENQHGQKLCNLRQ